MNVNNENINGNNDYEPNYMGNYDDNYAVPGKSLVIYIF